MHNVRRRRHWSRPHRYCLLRPPVPKGRAIDLRGNLHMIYAQDTIPTIPACSTKCTVGYVPRLYTIAAAVHQDTSIYNIHTARSSGCMSLVAPI